MVAAMVSRRFQIADPYRGFHAASIQRQVSRLRDETAAVQAH